MRRFTALIVRDVGREIRVCFWLKQTFLRCRIFYRGNFFFVIFSIKGVNQVWFSSINFTTFLKSFQMFNISMLGGTEKGWLFDSQPFLFRSCSSQKLLLIVVIFALLSITQAELGSALAYRKNYFILYSCPDSTKLIIRSIVASSLCEPYSVLRLAPNILANIW